MQLSMTMEARRGHFAGQKRSCTMSRTASRQAGGKLYAVEREALKT